MTATRHDDGQLMFEIPYFASQFPSNYGPHLSGWNVCQCSLAELVRSAVSVGRASWRHVFQFGISSIFEIGYRGCLIYANLKQDGPHLLRSDAYVALDPSEKSAVSYFLGLTSAKLMSERYLEVPWLMHLDVYQPRAV